MRTQTGGFPIGFRRGGSEWQRDLGELIGWAQENELTVVDLGRDGDSTVRQVVDAGLSVGSVDLPEWQGMISADEATRDAAVAKNAAYIKTCAESGPMNFFLVMLPDDPALPRTENFNYMVDSFGKLVPVLEMANSHIAIEGWPGPGALCCTPETCRAFFDACPSRTMGINYDPSHLVRQGIDYLRFLWEFGERVVHVHGKDTELLGENLYEYGSEQPPTFAERIPYGGMAWRYTIPGQGSIRWREILRILEGKGFEGSLSIELEDANFNGKEEGEKQGILLGAQFLTGC